MAIDPRILASLINVGGSALEGYGQGQQIDRNEAQSREALIAQFLAGERAGGPFARSRDLTRTRSIRDILGNASNVSVQAPSSIQPYVGQVSGGLRIPEGGLDVSGLSESALLGDQALDDERRAEILKVLNGTSSLLPEKKGGGFKAGLGKVLSIAAPIAASFIPGVGPALGALIAGAGSAGGAALAGGGTGDALLSGAAGAGSNYALNRFRIPRTPRPGSGAAAPGNEADEYGDYVRRYLDG